MIADCTRNGARHWRPLGHLIRPCSFGRELMLWWVIMLIQAVTLQCRDRAAADIESWRRIAQKRTAFSAL